MSRLLVDETELITLSGIDAAKAAIHARYVSAWLWAQLNADFTADNTEPIPEVVTVVALRIALRVATVAPGVTQETAGPYSRSYADAQLELLPSERELLTPWLAGTTTTGATGGLSTITTTRIDEQDSVAWIPVAGDPERRPYPVWWQW